jgi:hypothetical protein
VAHARIVFSRFTSLAGSYEPDGGDLQEYGELSETRTVRIEPAGSTRSGFRAQQHRRRQKASSDKEFVHFLLHARGSLLELHTQLLIAEELQYLRKEEGSRLLAMAEGVGRALSGLINSMTEKDGLKVSANDQRRRTNDYLCLNA